MSRQSKKVDSNQRSLPFEDAEATLGGPVTPDETLPVNEMSEEVNNAEVAPMQSPQHVAAPRIQPPKSRKGKAKEVPSDSFDFMRESLPFVSSLSDRPLVDRDYTVSQSKFLGQLPQEEIPVVNEAERAKLLREMIVKFHLYDLDTDVFKLFPKQHELIETVTGTGKSYMLSAAPGFGKTPHLIVQTLFAKNTPNPDLKGSCVYIAPLKKLTVQTVKSARQFTKEKESLKIHRVDGSVDKEKKYAIYEGDYDLLAVVGKTAIVDYLKIFANPNIKNVFIDEPQKETSSAEDPCIIEIVRLIRECRPDVCIHYVSGTLTKSEGKENIKIELRALAEHLGGAELYYVDRDGEEEYERPDIKIRSNKVYPELRDAANYYRQLAIQCRNEVVAALDQRGLMKYSPTPKNFEPSIAEFVKLKKLAEPLGLAGRCMQGVGYVQKYKRGMSVGGYPLLSGFYRDYTKRFYSPAFPFGGKLPEIGEIHRRPSSEDPYDIHDGILGLSEDGPYGHLIGKSSWSEVHEETADLRRELEDSIQRDLEKRGIRLDPCSRIRRKRMERYHKRLRSHLRELASQGIRVPDTVYRDSVYASIFHDFATLSIARGERSDHTKLEKLFDLFDEYPERFQSSPSLIFVNDRAFVDIVVARINHMAGDRGFLAAGLHSGYGSLCPKIIKTLNDGHYNILVSPLDSIGTGTHIPGVNTVVLYNLLISSPNSIVQGIKRAGRVIGVKSIDPLLIGLTVEGSPEEKWIMNSFPKHENYRWAVTQVGKEICAKFKLLGDE